MNTVNSREEPAFFNNDDIQSQSLFIDLADAETCSIVGTNDTKQQYWTSTEDFTFGL